MFARVPVPIGSAPVVDVPDIEADSRVVEVVVVVVSGVVQDVSTRAKTAAAGARMVSFFIFVLWYLHGDSWGAAPADVFRAEFLRHTIGTSRPDALDA